jgi:hypothetical protein
VLYKKTLLHFAAGFSCKELRITSLAYAVSYSWPLMKITMMATGLT